MKIKGEANTHWTTDNQEMDEKGQYRDETQTVTAHEEYFETKYYLIGSASGKVRLFIIYNQNFLFLIKIKQIISLIFFLNFYSIAFMFFC